MTALANWLQRRKLPGLPSRQGIGVHDRIIIGTTGNSIRLRIYTPENLLLPAPAMLWIHGGGFIIGTPEQDEQHSLELCRKLQLTVIAVDYRLAAEVPFPGPLEDCHSALMWLAQNAEELRIDRARISVGGNSAGAGLAAGLALLALDQRSVPINFQLLIYPMLDDRTVLRTDIDGRRLRLWTQASNRYGWTTYLGREPGGESISEYAAPARRRDLSGAPPAWIGVGTNDLFHDEDVAYANRLRAAGVPCELHVVQGAFHGFEIAGADKSVVKDFRQSYLDALAIHA
jgi:acetyl esterase/lipase